jgi:iron complex transport system substrate-binding protein
VPDRAKRLVADITAGLEKVRTSVSGREPTRILIVVGRRVGTLTDIVAVGPGSYLSDIATIAGGANVLSAVNAEYPRISMESVIRLAPDVILDLGEMGESRDTWDQRRSATESLWKRETLVKAVRERHVYVLHDEAFVVPGPRVVDVAAAMASLFHPEAAK